MSVPPGTGYDLSQDSQKYLCGLVLHVVSPESVEININ
jgi:hypothetical protein